MIQKISNWPVRAILLLLSLSLASGCSTAAPAPRVEPSQTPAATATQAPTLPPSATPTEAPTATFTPLPPTATLTPSATPTQTSTPEPTATQTPTVTPTIRPGSATSQKYILAYYILKDTGGDVACGDSVVPIITGALRTGDVEKDVKSALQYLFGNKSKDVGGLYNSLSASNISVDNVSFADFNGVISVRLSGTYVRSGDRCDNQRSRWQVWSTIRQFAGIKVVDILLNGNLLGDILANDH